MTNKQITWLKILGGLTLAYVALSVIASEGTVIDQTTGKPIGGAFVIAYWNGNTGWVVQPSTSCYYVEATTTNEKGRFDVSMFTGNLNPLRKDRTRNIHIYVPGYYATSKSDDEKLVFMMAPREGSKSEQFKDIVDMGNQGAGCSSGDKKSRLPFLRARQRELAALATTKSERTDAERELAYADILEFGEKIADEKFQKRRNTTLENER